MKRTDKLHLSAMSGIKTIGWLKLGVYYGLPAFERIISDLWDLENIVAYKVSISIPEFRWN